MEEGAIDRWCVSGMGGGKGGFILTTCLLLGWGFGVGRESVLVMVGGGVREDERLRMPFGGLGMMGMK